MTLIVQLSPSKSYSRHGQDSMGHGHSDDEGAELVLAPIIAIGFLRETRNLDFKLK